jgi:LEA14-like dessication related protein
LVFLLGSCSYENVELRGIENVQVRKLDKRGISFTARLRISNPNNYAIKVKNSDTELYLDGKKAGDARLVNRIVIPKNFDDIIEADVRTDFDGGSLQLIPVVLGAALSKKVDLRAVGTVKAKSFVVGQKFNFDYTHEAKF